MICLLLAPLVPASAQTYKWVDDKGVTHYGDRPPQGSKAQPVEQHLAAPMPAPGTSNQPSWKEKELEFRSRRVENQTKEAEQQRQEATRRQACNQARDQLAQMKLARRVYRLNEKGERVYQSDEERDASTAQLEQLVAQRCQ